MKKLIKSFMPPLLLDKMKYIRFDKSILKQNRILKNVGKGKRAFLLATGPSIKEENLKLLDGEDCFSVSNFFLHEDIDIINPKMHFFAPYHKPLILKNYIDWLRLADKQLPPNTKIFLGHTTRNIVIKNNLFQKREVFYVYLSPRHTRNIDLTKQIKSPSTGPLMILPVLIYMGYSEIYLLGCDHNVLKDYKKNCTHFYEKKDDLRKNASDDKAWSDIVSELKSSLNVFAQYREYNNIALKSDVKIYNLSQESWLDVFEKKKMTKLFRKIN